MTTISTTSGSREAIIVAHLLQLPNGSLLQLLAALINAAVIASQILSFFVHGLNKAYPTVLPIATHGSTSSEDSGAKERRGPTQEGSGGSCAPIKQLDLLL